MAHEHDASGRLVVELERVTADSPQDVRRAAWLARQQRGGGSFARVGVARHLPLWEPQPVQIDTAVHQVIRNRLRDAPLKAAVGATIGLIAVSTWVSSPLSLAFLAGAAAWAATKLDLRLSVGCVAVAVKAAAVEAVEAQRNDAAAGLAASADRRGIAVLGASPDGGLVQIPPSAGQWRRDFVVEPNIPFSFAGTGEGVVLVPLLDD